MSKRTILKATFDKNREYPVYVKKNRGLFKFKSKESARNRFPDCKFSFNGAEILPAIETVEEQKEADYPKHLGFGNWEFSDGSKRSDIKKAEAVKIETKIQENG